MALKYEKPAIGFADAQVDNFVIGPKRPLTEQTTDTELDLIG